MHLSIDNKLIKQMSNDKHRNQLGWVLPRTNGEHGRWQLDRLVAWQKLVLEYDKHGWVRCYPDLIELMVPWQRLVLVPQQTPLGFIQR